MPLNERLLNIINNRRRNTVKANLLTKTLDLYGKNIHFLIWQVILIIGAFIFVLHFFHIKFVPDFDITSLLGIFGLAALTGLLFVGVFISGFLYPLIFWFITLNSARGQEIAVQMQTDKSNANEEMRVKTKAPENLPIKDLPTDNTEQINSAEDTAQANATEDVPSKWKNKLSKIKNIAIWLMDKIAVRSIFILFVVPLIIGWGVFIYLVYHYAPEGNSFNGYFLLGALLAVLVAGFLLIVFISRSKSFPPLKSGEISIYLINLCACFVLLFITFLIIYGIFWSAEVSEKPKLLGDYGLNVTIFSSFFFVIAINGIQLDLFLNQSKSSYRKKIIQQIAIGAGILFVLTVLSENWYMIPEAVVRTYGLGNLPNTEIVLNKSGCEIVKQLGINFISVDGNESCRIHHCKILSRIGESYYLESDAKKRFVVPKEVIQTYAPERKKSKVIINITEVKNIQNKYLRTEIKMYKNDLLSINAISLILKNYDNTGKSIGESSLLNTFTLDSKDAGYMATVDSQKVEAIGWRDFILLNAGNEEDFTLKRFLKIE